MGTVTNLREKARITPRLFLFLALAGLAPAQDVRTVVSPNGRLEFRIFIEQAKGEGLSRIAYQVYAQGERIVDTSYLGIDIVNQEPLLGQYIGLIGTDKGASSDCNEMRVHYMQNGSLGRLLDIEARACDSKVEFRYVVPKSTPVADPFVVEDEKTEFAIAPAAAARVRIEEEGRDRYPAMSLIRERTSVTRLEAQFPTTAPFTTPWRVIRLIR